MRIVWSVPVRDERLTSTRGDMVRARSLIAALRAAGHDVRVVEAGAHRSGAAMVSVYRRIVRRVLPTGAAPVARDIGRVLHGWLHGRRVAAVAREHGAGLIVETQVHFTGSGAIAARRARVPLVLDDGSPAAAAARPGGGLPWLARFVFRRQCRRAAAVVVSSARLADLLAREGVPGEKLRVVPAGVLAEVHARAERLTSRARMEVMGECVIAFAGSFRPWHDTSLLVRAVAAIRGASRPRLLLIGDGPGAARTLDLARSLGIASHVRMLGAVDPREVPELLAGCDIGVVPGSDGYGQPMALLEYAAAGLPAVAPDLPPVRESLVPEETGLLFTPGDAGALARALERLIADYDLRHAMGRTARQRALREAAWKDRARSLLDAAAPALSAVRTVRTPGFARTGAPAVPWVHPGQRSPERG